MWVWGDVNSIEDVVRVFFRVLFWFDDLEVVLVSG